MRISFITNLVFILFCLGCNSKADQSPVALRLHYAKGDADTFIMRTKTDGGSMKMFYETEVKLIVDSVYSKGEKYDVALDMMTLKMETDFGDEKESYNSAKRIDEMSPAEKELDAEFRPFLNDTALFVVTNKGEAGAMKAKNGPGISAMNQPIDFSNLQIIFPDKEVKIGEEWTTEKTNPLLQNKTTSTYSVNRIEDDVVNISVTSKIGSIKNVLKENMLTGEYQVSKSTGRLKKANLQMPVQSIAGGGKIVYTITAK